MKVLGLDSTGASCSAGLWWDDKLVAQSFELMEEGQAASMLPMVAKVMGTARVQHLDAVAVTVGPGSFTGIRIGLAAARGLALAAGIDAVGITTLEAAAYAADADTAESLLVALESKRTDLFVQCFDRLRVAIGEPASVHPDDLADYLPSGPVRAVGDGRLRAVEACARAGRSVRMHAGPEQPHAATVARMAAGRLALGQPLLPPLPFYLRAPDVRLPEGERHR